MQTPQSPTSRTLLKWFLLTATALMFFDIINNWIVQDQIANDTYYRFRLGFQPKYFLAGFSVNLLGLYIALKTWVNTQKQKTPYRLLTRFFVLAILLFLISPFAYVPFWIRYQIGVSGQSDHFYLFGLKHVLFITALYYYVKLAVTRKTHLLKNT